MRSWWRRGIATRVLLGEGVLREGHFYAENAGVRDTRCYTKCTIGSSISSWMLIFSRRQNRVTNRKSMRLALLPRRLFDNGGHHGEPGVGTRDVHFDEDWTSICAAQGNES